jgi:CheY-like chemotaxis protein
MQVLNDVLDLAKIEAGKLTIEKADVDLRAVVTRCARFWAPRVRDAGLELDIDIPPETPPYVRLDPIRVGQIVFNLLSNAVKFTAHGTITLKVEVEDLGYGSHELVLSVRDTGIGIEPEAMSRLFTAFEQADGSITRRYGGTGLGLAIGQKLAAMMGGYISAVSSPGEGSTFFVRLPVGLCGPPAAEPADDEAAPMAASLRLLVAEDNPANQRIIELFLKPIAAEVTLVRNGREAVEAAQLAAFDVILMDMQMPVMDGLQAARAIRASGGPNAGAPILALTANVMESHRRACEEAGMDGHVAKPIDARLLMTAVMGAARPVDDAATDCALGAAQPAA